MPDPDSPANISSGTDCLPRGITETEGRKKDRSVTVRFRSRGLRVVGLRKQPPSFCEFNFGSKDQRYKIEGLDPNKESNKL